jgi:hypothetical protein
VADATSVFSDSWELDPGISVFPSMTVLHLKPDELRAKGLQSEGTGDAGKAKESPA